MLSELRTGGPARHSVWNGRSRSSIAIALRNDPRSDRGPVRRLVRSVVASRTSALHSALWCFHSPMTRPANVCVFHCKGERLPFFRQASTDCRTVCDLVCGRYRVAGDPGEMVALNHAYTPCGDKSSVEWRYEIKCNGIVVRLRQLLQR
jgi:hypothetical protein